MSDWEYIYWGDKFTAEKFKGKSCKAIRVNRKCIRGKNSNMLVEFENLHRVVVLARQLRKIKANEKI